MKKFSQSDTDTKNYDEYEDSENDYENSVRRDKEGNSRQNYNDRSNTYGNNYNPRINQHYDRQAGGNYNVPMTIIDKRDSNPYQSTYNDNNNFNNRNNLHSSRNNNDGRRNDSNDSNLRHERDRACILQCFFQELKMVKEVLFFFLFQLFFIFMQQRSEIKKVVVDVQDLSKDFEDALNNTSTILTFFY